MRKVVKISLIWFALSNMALAQQGPPSEQDILAATIGNLFKENARLAVELQRLQAQLQQERSNAKQNNAPSETDGRGGPQPGVREEGGRPDGGR